jgi:monofunctional biosynthetic peptidoglycan transglycosylase
VRGARFLAAALLILFVALVAGSAIHACMIPIGDLAHRVPKRTAMMRQREREAEARGRAFRIDRRWVAYGGISPLLRRAVLVAEDDAFFSHSGLDWNQIRSSAREDLEARRVVRGGSTITQQLAKNLFLGEQRTPLRKLEELFLALRLERALTKRRILELYLNEIEWGDGIFGVEAAARRYFGVGSGGLDERQALLLAAIIINPRRYSPLAPAKRIENRVRMIASRLRARGLLSQDQYLVAIGTPRPSHVPGFLRWLFGGSSSSDPKPRPSPPESASADSAAMKDAAPAESLATPP